MIEESQSADNAYLEKRIDEIRGQLTRFLDDLGDLAQGIIPEDNVDLHDIRESVALVANFLGNQFVYRTYTEAPEAVRKRQPVTDGFLNQVESATRGLRTRLEDQESMDVTSFDTSTLKRNLAKALERAARKDFAFLTVPEQAEMDRFLESIRERLRTLDDEYGLVSAAKRAQEAAASAEESATKASSAAGSTADQVMSAFYEKLGNDEQSTANLFRRWAIGLGSFAGAMAWVFLSGGDSLGFGWLDIAAGDYVHLIQRGLVLAAFFALATYLAKQAHQHRTMANWARSLAVQLKTFDAFVDAIDDASVRNELRQAFAARVFGDHPAVKGEPALSASSQSVTALTEVLAKVLPATK
jgi:hypothetical protein